MGLADAVREAGFIPDATQNRQDKKRYAEILAAAMAREVAKTLRELGFAGVKPLPGGPGEKEFQGGLGPKKVDVSCADERHGLLMAVSIKSITAAPYGKNLKNRFYDLCPEAITLHMRFPYSVICALFCFPAAADQDGTTRRMSTFRRARRLLSTISGRAEYTDPGEKFENVTLMLFQPLCPGTTEPSVRLIDSITQAEMTEQEYFLKLREIYNRRNPHAAIGEEYSLDDPAGEE